MQPARFKILLVEDDEDDHILVRKMLADVAGLQYELDWVASYEAALQALEERGYDVCLLDCRLGHRHGIELLQEMHARNCEVPSIVLTGYEEYELDLQAMKIGAADFLIKHQITGPILERSIRYAIEQKKFARAIASRGAELAQMVRERTAELEAANLALQNDIAERKQIEKQNAELIARLQQALREVRTLTGLLPICAGCKKIRDDKGYWNQVETYIRDRCNVRFTHGICPECMQKLYPEFKRK